MPGPLTVRRAIGLGGGGLLTLGVLVLLRRNLILGGDPAGYVGDAAGYWGYLPSLLFDGDLSLTNQPGPRHIVADGIPGRGRFPPGVALTFAPAFLIGHVLALLTPAAADGYSMPYQLAALVQQTLMLAFTAWSAATLARQRLGVGETPAAWACLAWMVGTNVLYYLPFEPASAHLTGCFWLSASLLLLHRAERSGTSGHAVLAFGCLAAMTVTRVTNLIFFAAAGLHTLRPFRRHPGPAWLVTAGLALAAAAIGVQYWHWSGLWNAPPGRHDQLGYGGDDHFYWTQPALVRVLLSSRGGLLFSAPVLILAIAGWWRLRRDALLLPAVGSALLLWYVNAAWTEWWFNSLGNRAFIELGPLWVIGLAATFGRAATWDRRRRRRRWLVGFAVVAVGWMVLQVLATPLRLYSYRHFLIPAEAWIEQAGWVRF